MCHGLRNKGKSRASLGPHISTVPTSALQTERSVASEFANTLVINGLTEKLLREGRSSYQSGDGGQAIAPEADFALFRV